MKRKIILVTFPVIVLMGIYFLGPEPARAKFNLVMPIVPQIPGELEKYISTQEGKHNIKPDNEARIIWSDSSKKKTEYSVVYIHGFYASQEEGDPVHADFAKKFGCNLYLARLADHGIDTVDQLINFTIDRGWASAKEALAIGKTLGEKVILMSTSTGGTLALALAAEYPQDVFALINMSPNIRINHPLAFIANDPWGLQIARLVRGGKFEVSKSDSLHDRYWYQKFRLEAVTQLQEFLEEKMNADTFEKIKCPSLTMYYYKNETEQDPTVKVSAMLEMNKQLGTPDDLKETVAIPNAGGHVLGSRVSSKDIPAVEVAAEKFAIEKLKMNKK